MSNACRFQAMVRPSATQLPRVSSSLPDSGSFRIDHFLRQPRWKIALLILSTLLLTFSFSPFSPFYLAWVALVPWLLAVHGARSSWSAFSWGCLGGVFFFGLTLTWLLHATFAGTVGLILYSAAFGGLAGALLHKCRLLEPRAWNPI